MRDPTSRPTPGALERVQRAFTLVELMVVVAIVGILAAIALPIYSGYTVRSKLSEAEAAIGACKTSVSAYMSKNAGAFPANATAAGCSTASTQYVASMAVNSGGVIAVTSTHTGASPSECTLTLTPVISGTDTIAVATWVGGYSGCSAKFVPSAFR